MAFSSSWYRVVLFFREIRINPVSQRVVCLGAVTLIQRFGSAANLNIPLHCLVLDGVYRSAEGEAVFQEARAPTPAELQALLVKIITRILRLLTRQGHLVEEQGMTYMAGIGSDHPLTLWAPPVGVVLGCPCESTFAKPRAPPAQQCAWELNLPTGLAIVLLCAYCFDQMRFVGLAGLS